MTKQDRKNAADERSKNRSLLSVSQQILALRDRPGQSSREITRLTKQL